MLGLEARACQYCSSSCRAELLNSIYERIVVRGEEIVRVRLTADAYAQGLAGALPEEMELAPEWVDGAPDRSRTRANHLQDTDRGP